MKILNVTSRSRDEFIDITEKIQQVVSSAGVIENGYCMLFVPHTTAGITINESADPSVKSDILMTLNALIPLGSRISPSGGKFGGPCQIDAGRRIATGGD